MRAPVKIDLPHLSAEKDRHGNDRLYVRRHGRRIRLLFAPGEPGFGEAYEAARAELDERKSPARRPGPARIAAAPRGTLAWLGAQYFGSPEFRALSAGSQQTRRLILEECFREPHKDKDPDPMGNCPLPYVTAAKVKRLRDLKAGKPGAANNRRKYLSAMFGWAVETGLMASNPARDVRRVRYTSAGFHTWSIEEVRQFTARHPVGGKARLALGLLLFTGLRRQDMVVLGRQHVRGDTFRLAPKKTLRARPEPTEKPWLPILAGIVAASPTGNMTFLTTEYGKPFTPAGFGGWFRKRCNEAGLPHCSAHGLRKAGATIAAENNATVHQLMALYDWTTARQAEVYTRSAERRRLAGQAMPLLAIGSE